MLPPHSKVEILPEFPAFRLKTATSTLAGVSSLPACPMGFGLAIPRSHVSQFLKINLSVCLSVSPFSSR